MILEDDSTNFTFSLILRMPECRWRMNKIQILKSRWHTISIRFRGFRGNRRQLTQSPPSLDCRFVKNAANMSNQVQRTDFSRFHGENGDERWHVQIKYKCDVVVTKSGQNWIEKNGEAKHHRRYGRIQIDTHSGNSFKKRILNVILLLSLRFTITSHTHITHSAPTILFCNFSDEIFKRILRLLVSWKQNREEREKEEEKEHENCPSVRVWVPCVVEHRTSIRFRYRARRLLRIFRVSTLSLLLWLPFVLHYYDIISIRGIDNNHVLRLVRKEEDVVECKIRHGEELNIDIFRCRWPNDLNEH